jgi:DNA replication and repair protein RecF
MTISSLYLWYFRSYTKSNYDFSSTINVIVGPNTIGKTNILEAIFMLAGGKSFRADKDIELINFDSEIARIRGNIINEKEAEKEKKLEIVITRGIVGGQKSQFKKYLVNGVAKRQMDFVGCERAVLFSPTDIELITDSPFLRRKYLDFVLVQIDREYRRALSSYEKGVRQRNKLLERIRDEAVPRSQLSFWDGLLIRNGNIISQKRREFINFVNYQEKQFGDFEMFYDNSEISADRLYKYSREEVLAATTLVGPHRDDWKICKKCKVKNKKEKEIEEIQRLSVSLYGSRGEQRMAVLWLKTAELEFVAGKSYERPILLLDDIFSELDEEHRKHILDIVHKQQTIITTTDLDHVDKSFLERVRVIRL